MVKMNAGAWIGIIGGIIGAVVGIGSVVAVGGSIGLYIGVGMLVMFGGMGYLFYKLFFQQMILAARLRKTGVSGKATIKDIQATNVTINYNPQIKLILDVKSSFGQTYAATVKTVVSRFQPFQYQIGMTVPVLIDPDDEQKLILDDTSNGSTSYNSAAQPKNNFAPNTIDYAALQSEMLQDQKEGDAIRLNGKPAKAIIKKYTWLGIYINGNNPYAEMQLEVLPTDAPAFAASVKAAIAALSVAKYQPGQEICVHYEGMKVAIAHS